MSEESPFDESRCLAYDPFSCDRDSDVTLFRDHIVTAAKEHHCCICQGTVAKGSRCRSRTEKWDGQMKTFRMCTHCCEAMAQSWTDNGEAVDKRTAIGMARAEGAAS